MGNNSIIFGELRFGTFNVTLTSNTIQSEYYVELYDDTDKSIFCQKAKFRNKKDALGEFHKQIYLALTNPKFKPIIDIIN
jgi:hypothetical protein